jgi:RNA polymerase subunit RPABC4/transcription elongation factor Spt4
MELVTDLAMIQCQNCGQTNAAESQFCRFCGTKFLVRQPMPQSGYDYQAPRPYAWKTDELQTHSEARKTAAGSGPGHSALVSPGAQYMTGNYRCPNCGTGYLPVIERRISTAGWITFAALLVFTVIFFWIGLLIKEDVRICPVCRVKLG